MAEQPLILHLDDEAVVRELVAQSLIRAGFRVAGAERLVDGIQLALKERPDVILLDLNMPDGHGFEACAALKAVPELRDVPVVILSGARELKERALIKKLGAAAFVAKPFATDELVAAIRGQLADRNP